MNSTVTEKSIIQAYEAARERYADFGVSTDHALENLAGISISLHCWQGDDVLGFENQDQALGGGLMTTGQYPGRARTADELRSDLDVAYSLIPGTHRLNLHAIYLESDELVVRNEIRPQHFARWAAWAKANNHGVDFNPTLFSHPLADDGFTLAHRDKAIRDFWIEHCIACREIGAFFGRELGTPAVTNIWIADGMKDTPADRKTPRLLLADSLDKIFAAPIDSQHNLDAVESKLFGLGSESYVVGSHEFYMGYAMSRQKLLCLDAGHFHPTETIGDKISAIMMYVPQLLLHVSRGVRWDSDHVVTQTDDLQLIMQEIIRGDYNGRVHIGLDFFDASINRIAAWIIGMRSSQKALLRALLDPLDILYDLEAAGDYTGRLALQEAVKAMPFSAVWDYFCVQQDVPIGFDFMDDVHAYEKQVLAQRV